MFIINKGQSNTVVVTLTEKCTLTNPNYLFEFTSKNTDDKKYCIAFDTSLYTERYNKFVIVETNTPDNLDGEVTLSPVGEWIYQIYEQVSATNLNPALATGLVETGLLNVIGTTTADSIYTSTQSIVAYES
jgi:hypothetical protein